MKDEIDTAMDFLTPSSTFHKQAPVINHIRRQQRYRQSDCMEIQIVTFEEQATAICNIRRAVFVDEQGIALEAEFDDSDKICIHVLALENGRPVGTARMKRNGRIGRLAVLKDGRLCGIGSAIMRTLEQYAPDETNRPTLVACPGSCGRFLTNAWATALLVLFSWKKTSPTD